MRKSFLFLIIVIPFIFSTSNFGEAQVIKPKARGTKSGGQTIDQAQREDEMGPKARVAVSDLRTRRQKGHRR